jgi:hypothetical protein
MERINTPGLQAVMQGMSGHIMQGAVSASITGVPASIVSRSGAFTIASCGHASAQSLHRVQPAKNCCSSIAPGGRKTGIKRFLAETAFSSVGATDSIEIPKLDRAEVRVAVGGAVAGCSDSRSARVVGYRMTNGFDCAGRISFQSFPCSRSRRLMFTDRQSDRLTCPT